MSFYDRAAIITLSVAFPLGIILGIALCLILNKVNNFNTKLINIIFDIQHSIHLHPCVTQREDVEF